MLVYSFQVALIFFHQPLNFVSSKKKKDVPEADDIRDTILLQLLKKNPYLPTLFFHHETVNQPSISILFLLKGKWFDFFHHFQRGLSHSFQDWLFTLFSDA